MTIATESSIKLFLAEYQRIAQQLPGHDLPWLQQLKAQAAADFSAQGFPTTRDEDWKYTNVAAITKQSFQLAPTSTFNHDNLALRKFLDTKLTPYQLVFIDGRFAAELSTISHKDNGLTITNLAQALTNDLVKTYLNSLAKKNTHAFKQLNTLFLQDGIFMQLVANTQLHYPIHLLFISSEQTTTTMSALHNLIIAEENSQATIIENYISLGQNKTFTNTQTEMFLEKHAQINHYKLQQENQQSFHIGTLEVQQQAHSQLTSHSFTLGGVLVRSDTNVALVAEQSHCLLNGLYLGSGRQHIDHHTCIDHQKPNSTSKEYYKGVLTDRARAVFNGKVLVAPGAIKTDAQQSNKNLLLSSDAEIDTKPQLEIYADDVKCTHGATVGQLDEAALFFLRSRGIDEAQARSLLIYAFIQELFEKIAPLELRRYLQNSLNSFLPSHIILEEIA